MWTWVPLFLLASFRAAGWSDTAARLAGFGAIAAGGPGACSPDVSPTAWGAPRRIRGHGGLRSLLPGDRLAVSVPRPWPRPSA